jgi:hypothetical protein
MKQIILVIIMSALVLPIIYANAEYEHLPSCTKAHLDWDEQFECEVEKQKQKLGLETDVEGTDTGMKISSSIDSLLGP